MLAMTKVRERTGKLLKKYFWEGFIAPALLSHLIWWPLALKYGFLGLYSENWPIAVTMIFGSLIAGMTSEGGGAVAFPVMTLILNISPGIARDFSMAIQSCGMTAAMLTILWMRIHVEWHSIIYCTIGTTAGLITGLEFISPVLSPPAKKMAFVAISSSFAVALFILNWEKKRKTFDWVQNINWWKILILLVTGFVGGTFTSFLGSGADLCSFSTLTLLFLVSEKVATPTSIVLMAVNSLVGVYWRHLMQEGISPVAWTYVAICAPIVVIGAPLGSLISSHFHRQVLAAAIYVLELASFITGFAVVKPSLRLTAATFGILGLGSILFWIMSLVGKKIHGVPVPKWYLTLCDIFSRNDLPDDKCETESGEGTEEAKPVSDVGPNDKEPRLTRVTLTTLDLPAT